MHQPNDASWLAFGLGIFVVAQAFSQVLRLPHVQHPPALAGKDINTRAFGNIPEKILSKAVQQRTREFKKTQLLRSHSRILSNGPLRANAFNLLAILLPIRRNPLKNPSNSA